MQNGIHVNESSLIIWFSYSSTLIFARFDEEKWWGKNSLSFVLSSHLKLKKKRMTGRMSLLSRIQFCILFLKLNAFIYRRRVMLTVHAGLIDFSYKMHRRYAEVILSFFWHLRQQILLANALDCLAYCDQRLVGCVCLFA